MRRWSAVGIGAAIVGLAITALNLPVGLIVFVIGLGVTAVDAMMKTQESRNAIVEENFNPEYRVYLAPLRKLQADIVAIVESHNESTTIRMIGEQAIEESKAVIGHAAKLVGASVEVKKALQGKGAAESDIADLEGRLETAASDEEKASLERALDARKAEVERYADLGRQQSSITARLREAEAALAEMKSRLILVASKPETVEDSGSELRENLGRLHALSESLGESDALLEEKKK